MESVFKELSKYLGINNNEILNFRYYVLSNSAIFVVGYKKILSYSLEQIVLSIKNNEFNIVGADLNIKELDKTNIVITGKINKIYLSKEL